MMVPLTNRTQNPTEAPLLQNKDSHALEMEGDAVHYRRKLCRASRSNVLKHDS